jgi:tRNA(adenine34) deaminase
VLNHPEYLIHHQWMSRAIALAEMAGEAGEVPVGAVLVSPSNTLVAEGENRRERDHDPTAHAEVVALRTAGQLCQTWKLLNHTLYVTLEPCPMCAGAIILSRVKTLVYGVDDFKTGSIRTVINLPDSSCSNHRLIVIGGILESTCRQQLQSWFAKRR